jgi:hypothetical protein
MNRHKCTVGPPRGIVRVTDDEHLVARAVPIHGLAGSLVVHIDGHCSSDGRCGGGDNPVLQLSTHHPHKWPPPPPSTTVRTIISSTMGRDVNGHFLPLFEAPVILHGRPLRFEYIGVQPI